MALKNTRSQTEILESCKIALHNVETNSVIQPLMEALGYNTAKIDQGKALLTTAKTLYISNREQEDAKGRAYQKFENQRNTIDSAYSLDRKKAKIVFKDNLTVFKELGLKGGLPRSYVKWLETISLFYNTLNNQPDVLSKLATLQVTPTHVTEMLTALDTLENARAAYIQAKGNAQNATKTKNKAFKDLEKWMSNFYAVAKIALAQEPQLLESLGKLVKS
ncbi:PQLLE family protein [Polaribacter sp. M15]